MSNNKTLAALKKVLPKLDDTAKLQLLAYCAGLADALNIRKEEQA